MNKLNRIARGALGWARIGAKAIANGEFIRTTPTIRRHDDLYLVSFPKSGATWMDFLMGNINAAMNDDGRAVTFFNIHNFVPDIHDSRDIPDIRDRFPGFRIIKSHSGLNPFYKNVVYILRDPRDVMVSYFHFLRGLGSFQGDFAHLIRSPRFGVAAWREHLRGWMEDSAASTRFALIKYEELKVNPADTLRRLYRLLGHDLSSSVIEDAIEKSSFERMRGLETEYNYGGRDLGKALNFMRRGKAGGWRDSLSPGDVEFINETCGAWMSRFGYNAE